MCVVGSVRLVQLVGCLVWWRSEERRVGKECGEGKRDGCESKAVENMWHD